MRLASILFIVLAVAAIAALVNAWFPTLATWALQQQRALQNEVATAVNDLRAGAPGAWLALLSAAGAYGFVHAVGPGHGKYLIGGVGLGQSISARRLLSIALASSLAQAFWAILLAYGGLYLLELPARRLTTIADTYLASVSYIAIGAIGAVLILRGIAGFRRRKAAAGHDHGHDEHAACGCHAHGPRPEHVAGLTSLRDTLVLIGSIAVRPCTGAVFLAGYRVATGHSLGWRCCGRDDGCRDRPADQSCRHFKRAREGRCLRIDRSVRRDHTGGPFAPGPGRCHDPLVQRAASALRCRLHVADIMELCLPLIPAPSSVCR